MTCTCGYKRHTEDFERRFTWHHIPWPIQQCDGSWTGEWGADMVGPGIRSRGHAVLAVIYFRLLKRMWSGAYLPSPFPTFTMSSQRGTTKMPILTCDMMTLFPEYPHVEHVSFYKKDGVYTPCLVIDYPIVEGIYIDV